MNKSILLAATAMVSAAALHIAIPASAQEVIEISPGDTVLVERYVREAPPPPVIEEHMTLRPGSIVPAAVPLRPFDGQPSLSRYSFFVSVDHKIVVTDPKTRVVVRILDQKS